MPRATPSADKILDTALDLAEVCGWERLYLHDVAEALGCDLAAIARHYGQKDDLVEAWLDRADRALFERARAADLAALSPSKRLEELLVAWLGGMATHRALTGQMLLYKLELGHVHLQVGALLRVSRTVQWWREAARRQNLHLSRVAEESLLSAVLLRTFVHWLRHPGEGDAELRALLRRQLRGGPLAWLLRR
ncbi:MULTISPECIES: TetR/AcrR family transcriptional regulator [unclassified Pseudomonas]|uniref:TetR/AcrR family transcriptional regulator n=1 Tax=unclassified Pseudomonas TaxID=196821 RepID=UPI00244BCFA2|nr:MULTISPECIES: TetR/AcrR family transcriptional regulator [unclassified Pseudomonas]MDH0896465.1 TetR/AcrR family transcriptional regulator [Pseudomonas sp. GD03875]MDH1067834.1 TetR/AcrR family transcriptional regulator [Pseudomonas sp. GD03985]